jgi:thiamine biosynthesis lipoprotein
MRLDFGGIAKGVFVDQVANRLAHWPGGTINVGGDMMIWGEPPSGDGWRIGVEDPAEATIDIATIELGPGVRRGVATSATNRRRWLVAGRAVHHLIDPVRGEPVAGTVASVTVVAPNATEADIGAKVVFLGYAEGDQQLPPGIELAVVVDTSGGVVVNDGQGGRTHEA